VKADVHDDKVIVNTIGNLRQTRGVLMRHRGAVPVPALELSWTTAILMVLCTKNLKQENRKTALQVESRLQEGEHAIVNPGDEAGED
jgi:hypothetical protein